MVARPVEDWAEKGSGGFWVQDQNMEGVLVQGEVPENLQSNVI